MQRLCYSIIFLFVLFLAPGIAGASILAPDQEVWFASHNKTFVVRPQKNYPPFSFVSSTPSIRPKGLAVDYLDLIARKIGAQQTYLEAKPLATILEDLKAGKEGIVLALSETDERDEYLYFSEPFITLPAVIVTRKDYKRGAQELTLADFNGKQVAVSSGYAVEGYIKDNYQRIIIEPVSDDEVGLQKLLLGEVNAAVMDLASLSYYTSQDMLSYVTVAGQTGFDYKLSFAIPKTMPELQVILNAGLKEITPSEKAIIKDRWITFPVDQAVEQHGLLSLLSFGTPVWIGMSVGGALIIMILLIVMVVHTRRHHRLHIAALSRSQEKEKKLSDLTLQLNELENANTVLTENMHEIQSLEQTIKEKIEHIND